MEKKDLEKSIVVVATELFLSLGFKSVTMDDIAVEMGISIKTVEGHMGKALKTLRMELAEFLPLFLERFHVTGDAFDDPKM